MGAITSTAAGKWSATGTWTGGVVPVEGDTVTINHDVEIDQDITIGADTATACVIASGKRLFYPSTAAGSYTVIFKCDLTITGTFELGTAANPVPSNRSITVKFNYSASLSSLKYGVTLGSSGSWISQGNSLSYDRAKLAANASASATSLTTDVSTGWLNTDSIALAPTSRTSTEFEKKALTAGASGTTLTIAAITNAHNGTSPTQGELANLTRNVVLTAYSTSHNWYHVTGTGSTTDWDWTEISYAGATYKPGVSIKATTGTVDINRCAFHDATYQQISYDAILTSGTIAITSNVFYNTCANYSYAIGYTFAGGTVPTGSLTITGNLIIGGGTGCNGIMWNELRHAASTLSTNTVAGVPSIGISLAAQPASVAAAPTISGNIAHSNGNYGCSFAGSSVTLGTLTVWRNAGHGLSLFSAHTVTVDTFIAFGNATANVGFSQGSVGNILFLSPVMSGDSSFATNYGVYIQTATGALTEARFESGDLSTATGIKVAHATADVFVGNVQGQVVRVVFDNCLMGASTEVSWQAVGPCETTNYVALHRKDQTAGSHVRYQGAGRIERDTTTYKAASPAVTGYPTSSTYKLVVSTVVVDALSGATKTPTVWVYKSASYNGSQPRLIVRRNVRGGVTSDTVLDTMTVAVSNWEQLTGTTVAASEDTVFTFFVDCDGTAGAVTVDDWAV